MNILSETLKNLRKDANLTQYELAKGLNIGQSTIVGYERGEREATISNLVKYAKYFKISLDYLCGLEDDFGYKSYIAQNSSLPTAPEYSAEEKQLIDIFRNMSHPQKIRFLAFGEGLTEPISSSKKNQ